MEHTPDIRLLQEKLTNVENLTFLDQGGFKAVYKGIVRGNTEAIKVIYIPPDIDEGEGLRDEIIGRVRREIDALNKCKSKYIVQLGSLPPELFQIGSNVYIIYSEEFLEGKSLRSRLKQGYITGLIELKELAVALIEAIRILKENNLIHRDIKPDNVMALQNPNRPFVVLDFGIAFKMHGTALTRNSRFRPGTLPYMAPEMFNPRFRETLDYRSDLYSVGVTLYEYASGKHPIAKRGDDEYTTMYRILRLSPVPLSNHRSDLPIEFCRIVDQLIKKLPALRPSIIETLLRKIKELS